MTEQKQAVEKKRTVEPLDPEMKAMRQINRILTALRPDQQERVIQWAASKANSARYATKVAHLGGNGLDVPAHQ